MRLLRCSEAGEFSLTEELYSDGAVPPYAILSHTWILDTEEVTFQDMTSGTGKKKLGYEKIQFCGEQARLDGLQYFWIDTCCIDKKSHTKVEEAINCMFGWYQRASKCYVYLSDVSIGGFAGNDQSFQRSRWFTRGWTLQELIAPTSVEFFSAEGKRLGDKDSLVQVIAEITGISVEALRGRPLSHFGVDERMSWAERRETKRGEDAAYSLLGIFEINMPLVYGEGRENALTRLLREIERSSKRKLSLPGEEQKLMLLDSLRFDQIDERRTIIKTAHVKTCEWLLKTSEYLAWLDATKLTDHHGFLWIKGKPGTGKSTLMKFALTNARKTMKGKVVISFFFNARGGVLEKSTIGTYRSLLLQILEQIPTLQGVFDLLNLSKSSISKPYQWSVESLKALLADVIRRLGESSVVCFVDALDEGEDNQILDMISFFEEVGEFAMSAGIKFQVCFSSRHYPHITITKGLCLNLEAQEGHYQDINNYLDSKLQIGHSEFAKQIRIELQEKASGSFLWIVLVVSMLNKEFDRGRMHDLRKRLQEIPADMHELFREILTRDSYDRDNLLLFVQWVLFSKQPLSPEQLYFAILSGVEPEALSKWDPNKMTRDAIGRFILNSSKGLAKITTSGSQKVQFNHESIPEYLLRENGLGNIWPGLGSNLQGQSHERLKHCCLNYMSFNIYTHQELYKGLPNASLQEAVARRKSASDAFPFLEYAVRNVLYHADVAAGYGIAQESFIQSFPFDHWIKIGNLFEEYEVCRHTEAMSLWDVLEKENMSNLIKVHLTSLSNEANVDSTQAESILVGTTLVGTRDEYTFEPKLSPSLNVPDSDAFEDAFEYEDCMSVESNGDDIASQAAVERTKPEILAVRQFGSFFGELEELHPLHDEALKKLGTKRFQENYRRILKLYVLKLMNEARSALERDTVTVLKSRPNRFQIAQRILAVMQDDEDLAKPLDDLSAQPVEKQSLEDWARNTYASPDAEPEQYAPSSDESEGGDDKVSDDENEESYRFEELNFPNITQANKFLQRGIPFQTLVLELRLLVIPASLREILESTPKRSIHISSMNNSSFMNRAKTFIEDYTAFEWDWWPLIGREPDLPPGRLRLRWEFCGQHLHKEISAKEANSIQQILGLIGDHPSKCFCCKTDTRPRDHTTIFQRIYRVMARTLNWNIPSSSLAPKGSPSKAQQLYTPANAATASASSTLAHDSTQTRPSTPPGNNSDSVTRAQGGYTSNIPTASQGDPFWVVFGVRDMHEFDEIENIGVTCLLNDSSFFKELKTRYNQHCWFFQRWLSPFRFRHCNFVQFEMINNNQVYCTGEALPDDHGHTSHYEYDPRPPRVKNPLIDRKLFSICLNACDPDCSWSLLPSFLHKCRPLPYNSYKWKRIPRKKSAFNVSWNQPEKVAFGIEADYAMSFAILFIYHVVFISSALGFWIYWLRNHPDDLQNASVPTFTVLGLIGAFWGLLGRRIGVS